MHDSILLAKSNEINVQQQGEDEIKTHQSLLNKAAFSIWLLVILMAFLGEVKPF
jgi:hypothetical protein